MKAAISDSRDFLMAFLVWVVVGAVVIISTDQQALHLSINGLNHAFLDPFFRYVTHLGDGIFGAFIVLLGFVYRIRFGIVASIAVAGSGLLAQLLKRQIFSQFKRPSFHFSDLLDYHWVDGVDLHSNFSFPSGHATVAFGIFFFLSFLTKHRWLKLLCFVGALIVAFSRVYISQHFFEDIYAGSILGVTITFTAFVVLRNKTWGEKGLVELFDQTRT